MSDPTDDPEDQAPNPASAPEKGSLRRRAARRLLDTASTLVSRARAEAQALAVGMERAPAGALDLDAEDKREISILIQAIEDEVEHYPFGAE